LRPGVEYGDALNVLAALARGDSADHVGAVVTVVEGMERALFAGHPGDAQARLVAYEYRH
jgi:hypothetical protein